jgi:predicted transcriptional regulator
MQTTGIVVIDSVPALLALVGLLKKQPSTARMIATALKVSKPTAYARVREIEKAGLSVKRTRVRQGLTGPLATVFYL